MANSSSKFLKLGLFVTAAMVVTMLAFYFVGQKQHLFSASFRISGNFVDVSGLQVGNNVRLAGVNIGSVEAVTIMSGNSVRVDMIISEDARKFIKKDAVASVGSESMMGNKVVVISPGSDELDVVSNQGVIHTSVPVSIDDILKDLRHTGSNVATITEDLTHMTGAIRSGRGTLGKMFMDKVLAADVTSTMNNLKEGSASFRETVESAQKSWLLWGSGKSKAEKKAEEKVESDEKAKAEVKEKKKAKESAAKLNVPT